MNRGLHVDALDAATVDEVVDVCAAPGGRQGRVDVRLREPERPRLLGIDRDRGLLHYHQLRKSEIPKLLQTLGARP